MTRSPNYATDRFVIGSTTLPLGEEVDQEVLRLVALLFFFDQEFLGVVEGIGAGLAVIQVWGRDPVRSRRWGVLRVVQPGSTSLR